MQEWYNGINHKVVDRAVDEYLNNAAQEWYKTWDIATNGGERDLTTFVTTTTIPNTKPSNFTRAASSYIPPIEWPSQAQIYVKSYQRMPTIKKVIFNNPATIVIWNDGTKTVVKAHNEEFSPDHGLAMAIAKKYFGDSRATFLKVLGKAAYQKQKKEEDSEDLSFGKLSEEFIGKMAEKAEMIDKFLKEEYPSDDK